MTTLKLHYDGWVMLPADLREKLGLKSGDRLEAELVGATVVLRPAAAATRRQTKPETPASEPAATAPAASSVEAVTPGKHKPGRKVRVIEEPAPAMPASEAGEPWKLRRKAEPPVANVGDDPAAAPARRPERVRFDTGYEREERHPFRQVEVRKLGPGRGHHRPRPRA